MAKPQIITLLDAITATARGALVSLWGKAKTVQARVSGTGAVTATVLVQVSNVPVPVITDDNDWITAATLTLSGTDSATDGAAIEASWLHTRARLSAISGTGATVSAWCAHTAE